MSTIYTAIFQGCFQRSTDYFEEEKRHFGREKDAGLSVCLEKHVVWLSVYVAYNVFRIQSSLALHLMNPKLPPISLTRSFFLRILTKMMSCRTLVDWGKYSFYGRWLCLISAIQRISI